MSSTESTQRLGGFEIEALLGRGGSGEVGAKWMDRRLAHREAVRVSSAVARALAEIDPEAAAWAVFAAWLDDVEPVPRAMYFYVVPSSSRWSSSSGRSIPPRRRPGARSES